MLTFLFWNIRKKPLGEYVALAAMEGKIDFVIIAECVEPVEILRHLHKVGLTTFNYHDTPVKSTVEVFSKLPLERVITLGDRGRLNFRHVRPVLGQEFLLIGAHLQSKLRMDDDDQAMNCAVLAERIREFEARVGHQRTILVGDLNMNPFERGLIAANGFHAAPTKVIARKGGRVVNGTRYNLFYNPMWGKFGDRYDGPAGTYFYDKSRLSEHFWHMFDQVLIRPELVDKFDNKSLEIISRIGSADLLQPNGQPNDKELSDHLPIRFTLDM